MGLIAALIVAATMAVALLACNLLPGMHFGMVLPVFNTHGCLKSTGEKMEKGKR